MSELEAYAEAWKCPYCRDVVGRPNQVCDECQEAIDRQRKAWPGPGLVIERAAALLEDGWRWWQFGSAADVRGVSAAPDSDDACAWCLTGALLRAAADVRAEVTGIPRTPYGARTETLELYEQAVTELYRLIFHQSAPSDVNPSAALAGWNDAQSDPGPVLEALRRGALEVWR